MSIAELSNSSLQSDHYHSRRFVLILIVTVALYTSIVHARTSLGAAVGLGGLYHSEFTTQFSDSNIYILVI